MRIDIGALESPVQAQPRRLNGNQPLVPGTGGSASAPVASPLRSLPHPVASAEAEVNVAPSMADVRIDPPILVAWKRVRDWLAVVLDAEAAR